MAISQCYNIYRKSESEGKNKMTVKSYFIDWSTYNEIMFEELRACGYVYDIENYYDNFLLNIYCKIFHYLFTL